MGNENRSLYPTQVESHDQVERAASIAELGAGVIHEARNMLTGVLGFAQVARREVDDGHHLAEMLSTIEKETKRCVQMLGGFLEYARVPGEASAPIAVEELLRKTGALVENQLRLSQTKLEVDCADHLPVPIGNAGELLQVLVNLLVNASYSGPRGGLISLRARAADANSHAGVAITVSDSGPGVPEDLMERIFDPFFTTRGADQGTGLGLSVSRRIACAHGGMLTVANRPEGGAEFTLWLPAQIEGDARAEG